jgi:hypothetical protein
MVEVAECGFPNVYHINIQVQPDVALLRVALLCLHFEKYALVQPEVSGLSAAL